MHEWLRGTTLTPPTTTVHYILLQPHGRLGCTWAMILRRKNTKAFKGSQIEPNEEEEE